MWCYINTWTNGTESFHIQTRVIKRSLKCIKILIPISIGKNLVQNLRLNGHKVTIVSRFKGADDTITWQQLRFGQAPEDATALVNLGRGIFSFFFLKAISEFWSLRSSYDKLSNCLSHFKFFSVKFSFYSRVNQIKNR